MSSSSFIYPYPGSTSSIESVDYQDSSSVMDFRRIGNDRIAVADPDVHQDIPNPPRKKPNKDKRGRRGKKPLTRAAERWVIAFQCVMIIIFALFVRYEPEQADALTISQMKKNAFLQSHSISDGFFPSQQEKEVHSNLEREREGKQTIIKLDTFYQDVQVMVFIGFGFLMSFLRKYSYSALGLTLFLACLGIQWSILCRGIFNHDKDGNINVEITSLINADFATAAPLISFGAVIGVASPFQLVTMMVIEIFLYAVNEHIGTELFEAVDVGGSIFIHIFGAYFGLAMSRTFKSASEINTKNEEASKLSDTFAMVGTVFLWLYWPSFNAAMAQGDDQHRAVLNTVLSLTASVLMSYVWSGMLSSSENKLNMVHVQNATLAGGVAVGAVADMMIRPFGALIIGSLAGTLSTLGYIYVTPLLQSKLGLHDTCGIHNLHGMPGILGGIASVIMAAIANEEVYGNSLYQQYPARAPLQNSSELSDIQNEFSDIQPGLNRTAGEQACYQLAAMAVTLSIAVVGGSLTGLLLRAPVFDVVPSDQHFDDAYLWEIPEEEQGLPGKGEGDRTTEVSGGITTTTSEFEVTTIANPTK